MASESDTVPGHLAVLPLLNSACQLAAFTYADLHGFHPLLGILLDLLERGLQALAEAATAGAAPILQRLEAPVAALISFVLRGLEEVAALVTVPEQLADEVPGSRASTMLLQASMLEATGGAEETAGWTEGDAPAEAVSDLGTVGVVSAPGAKAAPSWAEGDVTCSLPAAVNEEAKELMPRQTSGATDGTSGWLQVLLAAAVRLAWGSASGLWRILRKALALLLQWALVLRSRLRRALAALAKKGSSNVQPPAGTPQDAQPVGLPERTQSSSDAVSHQEHTASSEEEGESVEQSTRAERRGTGDWFAPGWEGLSATTDPGQPRSQDPSTSEEEK